MEGSLSEIHLGGLIRLLSLHRFTGALRLEDGETHGTLYLNAGRISGAVLDPNPHPIGKRLLELKRIKSGDLENALQAQKKDPKPKLLGHYLVDVLRVISPEDFSSALSVQAEEHIDRILRMETGQFRFEDGCKGFEDYPIRTGTENLILSSFRKIESTRASEGLPPGSAIMEWAPRAAEEPLEMALRKEEWNTLILFDGNRNLDGVLKLSPAGEGRSLVVVHALMSAGILKKVRFRFPDLEKIALQNLGNMGVVLVQNAYHNTGVSRARMGMRELVRILNELERAMNLIVGPTRASEIAEQMWESVKR